MGHGPRRLPHRFRFADGRARDRQRAKRRDQRTGRGQLPVGLPVRPADRRWSRRTTAQQRRELGSYGIRRQSHGRLQLDWPGHALADRKPFACRSRFARDRKRSELHDRRTG